MQSIRTRLAAITVAAAVALGGIVAGGVTVAAPAAAATLAVTVPAGKTLYPGDSVTSANGQFRLVMQGDGNLVEYGVGNRVLWASNTPNAPGAEARVRTDGMLVIMRGTTKVAYWGKSGYTAGGLTVGADGNIAMRDTAKVSRWTLGTFQDRVTAGNGIVLTGGTVLRPDMTSGRFLRMQTDGDLVQFDHTAVVWRSGTAGHPGAYTAVQADGNLVVYGPDRKALWASNTSRNGGGQLLTQLDGNVVLYGKDGTRSWSTRPVAGLRWPVTSHTITGRFGDDRGAGHTPRYHQGADAGVKTGTAVFASGSGKVTKTVANDPTFGNYVVVTYGLTTVLTAHLSVIEVSNGQNVSLGSEIAKSGNTGQSTGPHVHVETRVNGTLKDPLTLLSWR